MSSLPACVLFATSDLELFASSLSLSEEENFRFKRVMDSYTEKCMINNAKRIKPSMSKKKTTLTALELAIKFIHNKIAGRSAAGKMLFFCWVKTF